MATVKKSKKRVIVPICIVLVIAIVAGSVFAFAKSGSGEEVELHTITTDDIFIKFRYAMIFTWFFFRWGISFSF